MTDKDKPVVQHIHIHNYAKPKKARRKSAAPKSSKVVNEIKKLHFDNALFPLIAAIIFGVLFTILYSLNNPNPANVSESVISPIERYGSYAPIGFSIIFLVLTYIVYSIKSAFKIRSRIANPIVLFIGNLFNLYWGVQINFLEGPYTEVGRAIIVYFGSPLFWSAIAIAGLSAAWLVFAIIKGDDQ